MAYLLILIALEAQAQGRPAAGGTLSSCLRRAHVDHRRRAEFRGRALPASRPQPPPAPASSLPRLDSTATADCSCLGWFSAFFHLFSIELFPIKTKKRLVMSALRPNQLLNPIKIDWFYKSLISTDKELLKIVQLRLIWQGLVVRAATTLV